MLKVVLALARGIDLGTRDLGDLLEVRDMLAGRVTEWEQGWLQQGRTEGEAKALIRLIERRFGPVDAGLRNRILSADSSQIVTAQVPPCSPTLAGRGSYPPSGTFGRRHR